MKKRCNSCKRLLHVSEFWKHGTREDGLQASCKGCLGKANKLVRTRKRQAVFKYLQEHPCVDCGEDDPVFLELDHVRGEKSRTVAALVSDSVSLKTVLAEIKKCDVRCVKCYRRKTILHSGQLPWMEGFELPEAILKQLQETG